MVRLMYTALPVVKYVCDDDREQAKKEHCSAGIDHRVEHPYRVGRGVREVRHLLDKINHTPVK